MLYIGDFFTGETTSPKSRTFGKACSDFTKGVQKRLRPSKGDEDQAAVAGTNVSSGQNRVYGDGDEEEFDKEELAKVVTVQLEREKQKQLSFEPVVHANESQRNSYQEQEYRPTQQQNAGINK